jgi:hypothetical protein
LADFTTTTPELKFSVHTGGSLSAKVHCDNAVCMVANQRLPSLPGRAPPPRHVLGDADLADVDVELEKFSVDSWRSPQRLCNAHLVDQPANFRRCSWSAAAVPAATSAQSAVGQDNSRAVAEYRNCLAANPSRVNTCDGLHHIMDADARVLSGSALPQQNSADTTQGR